MKKKKRSAIYFYEGRSVFNWVLRAAALPIPNFLHSIGPHSDAIFSLPK